MKLKIVVTGKVHEVGFRPYLLNLAETLFIPRFDARNISIEGKQAVQILVEGEEDQVKEFLNRMRKEAPELAEIEEIISMEYHGEVRPIDEYRSSLMVEQLSKIVQVGLSMVGKQEETIKELKELRSDLTNYTKEFKDYREEFQDYRGEFRDYREEFRDFREEFKDYREEFRNYRGEFREFAQRTDKNFQIIMEKYGEISRKLTEIMDTLLEESRKTSEILDNLRKESKETREILNKNLELLRQAVEKLSQKP